MSTPLPRHVTNSRLLWLAVFGIAMGLLEAIVVVYLRELYFPGGFRFPLRFIPEQMLRTEILRELSTMVMLVALAAIAARTFVLRFASFSSPSGSGTFSTIFSSRSCWTGRSPSSPGMCCS